MSILVKWKFYERIFWTAHFQQLWAHGIVSSQFLVKWVPDLSITSKPWCRQWFSGLGSMRTLGLTCEVSEDVWCQPPNGWSRFYLAVSALAPVYIQLQSWPGARPTKEISTELKFDQNLECSGLKCVQPITTKSCARHDNVTDICWISLWSPV